MVTLDHMQPRSMGGSNHETNLVTACISCNSRRADMPLKAFAGSMGVSWKKIRRQALLPLPEKVGVQVNE